MRKITLILILLISAIKLSAQTVRYTPPVQSTVDGSQDPPPLTTIDDTTRNVNQDGADEGPDVAVLTEPDTGMYYSYAEQMPAAPYDFNQYLQQNIKYPADAKAAGAQGTVYLSFIVETNGAITQVEVKKSSGNKSLDAESVRAMTAMPKWNPGKMNGRAVRVQVIQPVRFVLPPKDPPKTSDGK